MTDLNSRLLKAHEDNDKAALVTLYAQAAEQTRDTDTACFFLTQAYVFALETGHPTTNDLKFKLAHHGRI